MQTVKEKLSDMKEMRKVKAEAKAEEQAERELAKARVDIAHEVRLAKEAEGTMELHVAKAGKKAEREIAKHAANHPIGRPKDHGPTGANIDPHGKPAGPTTTAGLENTSNAAGAPPKNNDLLPPDFNVFTSTNK